jgi:serine/threonine protein phosphatase PrpC
MRIEIGRTLVLAKRDTVLVASDGLFDNLRIPEIVEIIRAGPLEKALDRLGNMALQRMQEPDKDHPCKPDDLGIVMFRRD